VEACVTSVLACFESVLCCTVDWFQRDPAQDTVLCHVGGTRSDRRTWHVVPNRASSPAVCTHEQSEVQLDVVDNSRAVVASRPSFVTTLVVVHNAKSFPIARWFTASSFRNTPESGIITVHENSLSLPCSPLCKSLFAFSDLDSGFSTVLSRSAKSHYLSDSYCNIATSHSILLCSWCERISKMKWQC